MNCKVFTLHSPPPNIENSPLTDCNIIIYCNKLFIIDRNSINETATQTHVHIFIARLNTTSIVCMSRIVRKLNVILV